MEKRYCIVWKDQNEPPYVGHHTYETEQLAKQEMAYPSAQKVVEAPLNVNVWCAVHLTQRLKPTPWARERWFEFSPLFPHVDPADPTKVRYLQGDRLISQKPGRFLKAHYGFEPKRIEGLAQWFLTGAKPAPDVEADLCFATTPDEIVEAYKTGPHSCMSKMDCVRVYGAGDLAIAYLNSASQGIIARALCWPAKKAFGRVYPNEDDDQGDFREALYLRLKAEGYTHVSEDENCLEGAKLLLIGNTRTKVVMPYLDSGYGFKVEEDHCVLTRKPGLYVCDYTDGYYRFSDHDEDEYEDCDRAVCGQSVCDRIWIADLAQSWCENCTEEHAFFCRGSSSYYSNETPRAGDYTLEYAEANLYFYDNAWHRLPPPPASGAPFILKRSDGKYFQGAEHYPAWVADRDLAQILTSVPEHYCYSGFRHEFETENLPDPDSDSANQLVLVSDSHGRYSLGLHNGWTRHKELARPLTRREASMYYSTYSREPYVAPEASPEPRWVRVRLHGAYICNRTTCESDPDPQFAVIWNFYELPDQLRRLDYDYEDADGPDQPPIPQRLVHILNYDGDRYLNSDFGWSTTPHVWDLNDRTKTPTWLRHDVLAGSYNSQPVTPELEAA